MTATASGPPLRLTATATRAGAGAVPAARLLAAAVASMGLLEALLVEDGATGTLLSLASVVIAPALWRGRRRACLFAVALLIGPILLPSADTLHDFSIARIAIAVALLCAWRAFPAIGEPSTRRTAAIGLLASASAAIADLADARGLIVHPLLDATVATGIIVVVATLGPWRRAPAPTIADRERAADLVRRFGVDTLAPFALRADKTYFFASENDAFLTYRVVAGVALVSGDPIGVAESVPRLVERFCTFARTRGWTVSAIGLSADGLAVWRATGFRGHYIGEEAIVDPARFTLEGRAVRKVRQSVHRLANNGYTSRILRTEQVDDRLAHQLATIADHWRGADRETGFSMAFAGAAVSPGRDDLYVVAFDESGQPRGFLHLGVAPAAPAVSLSSMRRERDTPNGLNEFLICALLDWARAGDLAIVSLNFAAFAAVLDPHATLDRTSGLERRALLCLSGRFQFERLRAFNRKFATGWTPRYAAYPSCGSLPRIVLAAMLAEGYVSAPGQRRRPG